MPTLVVILGPTGVGKTALSLQLAEEYGCPIVSADSRQIYRALPIGTAAPTAEEQARVKHYFVGCKELTESYSAGQYARDCRALLGELFQQYERVVMVGGSMMYIDAVCKGLDDIPDVPEAVRRQVQSQYAEHGLAWLQEQVQTIDPVYWAEVDQQNPQRLMHCVEVTRASGKPYSTFRVSGVGNSVAKNEFDIEYRMVERPREELYERINQRVHQMVADGLLEEARCAFEELDIALTPQIGEEQELLPNSVNTVGYRELLPYFRGEYPLERAIELIQQNSRHYAKRQMTWWRRQGAMTI